MNKGILGIDEAGRGCVIGPLVMAALLVDEERLEALRELGVKDSKCLSPVKRRGFLEPIHDLSSRIEIVEIPPAQIDAAVREHGLDRLEAVTCAGMIDAILPEIAYIDAPGPGGHAFERHIRANLNSTGTSLICENGADARYPVVSAASILAKERREEAIRALREEHGDFGSGYPSDPKTREYLKALLSKEKEVPPFIRAEWATVRRLRDEDIPLFSRRP